MTHLTISTPTRSPGTARWGCGASTLCVVALLVVLTCLATYRLTRLLTADAFPPVAALRDRIEGRFGEDSSVTYLANCPWCVSVYVGAAVVAATDHFATGGLTAPVLVWATASAVTGLIATLEPA